MKNRKPKINPKIDGNKIDLVSMTIMRNEFVSKKLPEIFSNQRTLLYLGKLIILENLLSYKLSYYFRALENRVNTKLKLKKISIQTHDPIKLLSSGVTLGSIIHEIERISPKNALLISLKKFNEDRNLLTHYMHLGFSSTLEISRKARGLNLKAEKLLDQIEQEYKKITPKFKIKVPKVINISELISFEKEKSQALYPDSSDIKNNLKKFNQLNKLRSKQQKHISKNIGPRIPPSTS